MSTYVFADPKLFPVHLLGFVDPTDYYAYKGILTDSGEIRKYDSFEELTKHIVERRAALDYPPITHLEFKIQHYLYLIGEAPRSHFAKTRIIYPDIPREVISDIRTGAKLILEFSRQALTGIFTAGASGWATKHEAERRAWTCANCPKNVDLRKSALQRLNDRIAALFTLNRNTPFDKQLFDCGVCGCALVEKVHFDKQVLKSTTGKKFTPNLFPEPFIGTIDRERHECWMRKILEEN